MILYDSRVICDRFCMGRRLRLFVTYAVGERVAGSLGDGSLKKSWPIIAFPCSKPGGLAEYKDIGIHQLVVYKVI